MNELKIGDKVLVRVYGSNEWEEWDERIFIKLNKDKTIMCVTKLFEKEFYNDEEFEICKWRYWKPLPQKKIYTIYMRRLSIIYG